MPAPAQGRQGREEPPMPGDVAVKPFAEAGEARGMVIPAEQRVLARVISARAKGSLGAVENRAVGFDQVEGSFQAFAWQLGKSQGHAGVLEWEIVNPLASGMLPTLHPETAEGAVAIIDNEWFGRRGGHLDGGFHDAVIT